jgi:PAS domain S-box-containing protein
MSIVSQPIGWRPWHSLRWRLPLTIALVVATILAAVLLGAYREVRSALTDSGTKRAAAAAGQVAALIEAVLRPVTTQLRTAATEPALRDYVANPTADNRARAEEVLRRLLPGSGRRIATLWDARGNRLVEVSTLNAAAAGPADIQPGDAPAGEGFELQRAGDGALLQSSAIVPGVYPLHEMLGYVVVRSAFAISPRGLFSSLVGDDATVFLGRNDTDLWVDLASQRLAERRSRALDDTHIGQIADVRDTRLQVAVDFPAAVILAPARRFLQRMIVLGLLIAIASGVAVRELTARFAQPLVDLTEATEAVAAGNFSRKIGSTRRDELGRLGRAFDTMTLRLAEDIAARDRAVHALQENEERLRYTLSAAQVGIFQVDLKTGAVQWSETMGPLFGRRRADLPATIDAAMSLLHHEDREPAKATLARDADDEREYEVFFRALQPDGGYRSLVARSRQLVDASGHRWIAGVCIDVTEQKTLEEQLRQAQKMDAIGKLAGGIAHDFNNLLTAILGFSNMLLESLGDDDLRTKNVHEILRAGNRAADLTSQLLAFSRKQLVQPIIVDVNTAIDETAVLLRRLIGENIRLETRLAPGGALVRADPVQLQQVIMNLAINSRDAMPDGGRLTIEIVRVDLDASLAGLPFSTAPGPYVRIGVSDTGVGMTQAVRARLFEPFFTTKKRGEGTGLGLATVYGAVKQAGGSIVVEGEPGHGSTFTVYLPRIVEDVPSSAPMAKPASSGAGNETILLVEDEMAVRFLSRTMLERAGYRVLEAASAEAAEIVHLEHAGSITLLITDVVLPGSSGADLFQKLSIRDPHLKVLYMSGYTDDAVFRTGRLQHGVAFLQKPFTANDLRRKTREVLDE